MARLVFNDAAQPAIDPFDDPGDAPQRFHERLPGYEPTPLVSFPTLADDVSVSRVWLKDETRRLGLPAFKILGASWAAYRALVDKLGRDPEPWFNVENLKAKFELLQPLTLVTASDGNHGRAVAHVATMFGLQSHIYLPEGTSAARRGAILDEGGAVTMVGGAYDDAVAKAASKADHEHLVISDTSWEGYTEIPTHVIEGYSTIFREIDAVTAADAESPPDLVFVQVGVGALAAAAVRHYRAPGRETPARIVGFEPEGAECLAESIAAGERVTVPGPHRSVMSGMNCGTLSLVAWPALRQGVDAALVLPDSRAHQAMELLAGVGIAAGETGASGLGALIELLDGPNAPEARERLGITAETRILILATEGATDPGRYRDIVGRSAATVRGEADNDAPWDIFTNAG